MLFDQDHVHPHIYAIPTLGICNHISICYCSMRIKVTSLCCLTSKERHGLQKKMRENKRAKSSSIQRERERNRVRKRKQPCPLKRSQGRETSQRTTTSTKYTTHMHVFINLYDLLLLVIQVFDLAIDSIQVSYAFTPTLSST